MSKLITHVAIIYKGKTHSLPCPNRHHHVIRAIAAENGIGIKGPDIQGFLDSDGEFLTRKQAFLLASENGQLNRIPHQYCGNELYSEDIW